MAPRSQLLEHFSQADPLEGMGDLDGKYLLHIPNTSTKIKLFCKIFDDSRV
jgi:hypothetical protein